MTRVLVVGKCNRLVNWTENTVDAFRQVGCTVQRFATNGENPLHAQYFKWRRAWLGDDTPAITKSLLHKVAAFKPDLIVFVLGAWLPESVFQALEAAHPDAIKVAWVGDVFDREQGVFASYMDWIFCTDSYFIDLLREHGCTVPASYLPLAMNPQRFSPMNKARINRIVYVAQNTPGRAEFISQVKQPLTLYGRKWKSFERQFNATPHQIRARHLPLHQVPLVYASSRAVLNIKHEQRVARGVNQRSFEPYGVQTPVLNDAVEDLALCFDLGSEILVYRSLDELHELHAKLTFDPAFAQKVGLAGHQRVMAHHTYAHRARSMLKQLGLAPSEK